MDRLKVCFVGIGSIAKRHIVNLSEICREDNIELKVDALRHTLSDLPSEVNSIISNTYLRENDMPSDYDVIFITNPTEYHIDTLKCLHDKGKNFFIEKPLTSYKNLSSVYDINYRPESIYYVACPLRYTNVIQYMKDIIKNEKVLCVRSISSSYLPEWRENVDYRKTYSANRNLGGGVSLDLIHEWDYLQYLFGEPEQILYHASKKSGLELDCEDCAFYIAEYKDKIIELHLDYFGRKPIRQVMLFTENDTIVGDLTNSTVTYLKDGKSVLLEEKRNSFQKKELRYFLKMINKEVENNNNIEQAVKTIKYTQGVVR
ncbi:MAG: Gfo/Idh/MocA family oxidoreductase [Agathobacter sp.]|nr:Gfo/Idh/MocA family oxidoreductase [Agathobacter sp.]